MDSKMYMEIHIMEHNKSFQNEGFRQRDVNFMHNMPSSLNGHISVVRNTPVALQCLCFRDSCSSKKKQRMSDPTKPTAKHNHLNIFSKD